MPVIDNYSHENVDKTLYQMYKHQNSENYIKVMDTLKKSRTMLKNIKISITNMNGLGSRGYV